MKLWHSPHGTPLPDYRQRPVLMGILNVTPDSFSDGGAYDGVDKALRQAEEMITQGADIIDIGGESTRPGADKVEAREERERVLPVIQAIRHRFPRIPLSIDTYKAEVADAAIDSGADLINDVWGFAHGLSEDPSSGDQRSPMAGVAVRWNCPAILMHNRPQPMEGDFWPTFLCECRAMIERATSAGLADEQIWIDPGFGFGKTPAQNLEILHSLERFVDLGYPVLLGTSRKSTLGLVLEAEVDQRHPGTAASNIWGLAKGCHMVRVHEVARLRPYLKMCEAMQQGLKYRFP
ncbi:MAG: dihydropteroate synthase [Opitutales bacterium]|nr:dihydropteroate synthase [Opitutales bacterium]